MTLDPAQQKIHDAISKQIKDLNELAGSVNSSKLSDQERGNINSQVGRDEEKILDAIASSGLPDDVKNSLRGEAAQTSHAANEADWMRANMK